MIQNIPGSDIIISLDIPWIDIILGVVVLTSAAIGWFRGFIKEMLSLFVWAFGIFLAGKYGKTLFVDYPSINQFLSNYISNYHVKLGVIFVVLFICILILGGMVNFLLARLIKFTGVASTDKTLGLVFGFGRGLLILSAGTLLLVNAEMNNTQLLQKSTFVPPLTSIGNYLSGNFASLYGSYENDLKSKYDALL